MFAILRQPLYLVLILGILLDVREVARTIALIAKGRRRSVELRKSSEARRAADSSGRRAPGAAEPLTTQEVTARRRFEDPRYAPRGSASVGE